MDGTTLKTCPRCGEKKTVDPAKREQEFSAAVPTQTPNYPFLPRGSIYTKYHIHSLPLWNQALKDHPNSCIGGPNSMVAYMDSLVFVAHTYVSIRTQRVQSTYIVECRVSILGIPIMIWGSIPHNSAQDPSGEEKPL